MSEEEAKAIYRLKFHNEGAGLGNGTVIVNKVDLETVLNMLEEKDKEMNEEDYIQLQTLLAKFRVVAMKEYGSKDTPMKIKEQDLKIIRKIDYLRNHTILQIYKR